MKKFIVKSSDEKDIEYIVSETSDLQQFLEYLTEFTKSCGYKLDGYLDVFPYDDGK